MKHSILTTLTFCILFFVLLLVFVVGNPAQASMQMFLFRGIWVLFLTGILFLMLRTGRVDSFRSVFFVLFAFCFVFVFIADLIETRGSMALTQEVIDAHETPLCPVAIPMLILPAVFRNTLIFPTRLYGGPWGGFFPILFLWIVSVFALGRGWCSWGCFYGGIDEGMSRLLKRKPVPIRRVSRWLRWLPFGVLLLIVVWAFLAMSPVYCEWLCPLKLVTEYPEINSPLTYLQAVIFITLGVGLLFILPVLTGKRIHCSFFCPLGALQSWLGVMNPYRIRIDTDNCVRCGHCIQVCPHAAIQEKSLRTGRVGLNCSKCMACVNHCPRDAIRLTLLGRPLYIASGIPRFFRELFSPQALFVFTGLLFGGILSGGIVSIAFYRLYLLFTTGSVLIQ